MNKLDIQAMLALSPQEAAAVIKKKFRARKWPEDKAREDNYHFLVDPTIAIPSSVFEVLDESTAFSIAYGELKDVMSDFADRLRKSNEWGVVGYAIQDSFLYLSVRPGYLERNGKIRRSVDPRVIPGLLVTLDAVKERLDAAVKLLVDKMHYPRWWHEMGWMSAAPKKQDWTPREDRWDT